MGFSPPFGPAGRLSTAAVKPVQPGLPPLAMAVIWVAVAVPTMGVAVEAAEAVRQVSLETSDGEKIAAWYYPPPTPEEDAKPKNRPPAAILLHDLEGSHEELEPVAKAIQEAGCGVLAIDLRGHGDSRFEGAEDARRLKKQHFDRMAISIGGQKRDQATEYGDVEAGRRWLRDKAASDVDVGRLFVVGSGLGGTVAANWAAADWAWPDIATGPQGRDVRALVLISPVFTSRGFSIAPALQAEPLKRSGRVLILAGNQDRDATRIFDQLKKLRPDSWLEQRPGQAEPTTAPALAKKAAASGKDDAEDATEVMRRATVLLFQLDSPLRADALASDEDISLGPFVANFLASLPEDEDR
jgi:pimeloyl-ACP methyl ester carboxylesterase